MKFISSVSAVISALPYVLATDYYHQPQHYFVQVGVNADLVYHPPYISAKRGDVVTFQFNPKNHTVTQSSFKEPCSPLLGGFATGFIPVAPGADPVERTFTVVDESPQWFYCSQVNHCASGMVFAINPADKFNDFLEGAKKTGNEPTYQSPAPTYDSNPTYKPDHKPEYSKPEEKKQDDYKPEETHEDYKTDYKPEEKYDDYKPEEKYDDYKPVYKPEPKHINVNVGPDMKLMYEDANIKANVGDKVVFKFFPKNHTVTQSSFKYPCQALDGGFDSGFNPVGPDVKPEDQPTFILEIKDTTPIFGYCGQVNHCTSGMVFTINTDDNGPENFTNFQERAKKPGSPDYGRRSAKWRRAA